MSDDMSAKLGEYEKPRMTLDKLIDVLLGMQSCGYGATR